MSNQRVRPVVIISMKSLHGGKTDHMVTCDEHAILYRHVVIARRSFEGLQIGIYGRRS